MTKQVNNTHVHRAPWFLQNFHKRMEEWVQTEVVKARHTLTGMLEQVKESDFCLIVRVPTTEGDFYFKATGSAASHEAALSEHLDNTYPGKSVAIVATNQSEGWLLMKDVEGEPLRCLKDKELWMRAIHHYAELQVSEVENVETLLSIGVTDRRMHVIKGEIAQHLAGMCATGLNEEETAKVMALQPELLRMCDEMDKILPATLDHGDLHSANIRLVRGDIVFFDWGDASVTHPFFSTRVFWHALDDLIESESEWLAMVNEFRPYYLEPWTKFAPMHELEKALQISDQLACVVRALSWHLYLTPSREDKAESFKRPSQWLQLLLEHRALVGSE